MVGSTLNIRNFCVEQSKDHCRWTNIIRAFLVWNWFSSIIIKHIELWCILLFSAELSKIISSHGIYKTTWGEKQSVLESTSNFWYESTLYLFQGLRKQWMFEHLHETAWFGLHLGVELFTKVHVDVEIFKLVAIVKHTLVCRVDLVFFDVYDGLLLRLDLGLRKDQVHHILNVNTSSRVSRLQFFVQADRNIDFSLLAEVQHSILRYSYILYSFAPPISILVRRILLILRICHISFNDFDLLQTNFRFTWLSSSNGIIDLALVDAHALIFIHSIIILVQQFTLLVCFNLEEVSILSEYNVLFYFFNAYLQIYQEIYDFKFSVWILIIVECHHFVVVCLNSMQKMIQHFHVPRILHSSPSCLNLINSSATSTNCHGWSTHSCWADGSIVWSWPFNYWESILIEFIVFVFLVCASSIQSILIWLILKKFRTLLVYCGNVVQLLSKEMLWLLQLLGAFKLPVCLTLLLLGQLILTWLILLCCHHSLWLRWRSKTFDLYALLIFTDVISLLLHHSLLRSIRVSHYLLRRIVLSID